MNSYLFVNSVEIGKFKAKDSEITAASLCLGNYSKYLSTDNMKKTYIKSHKYLKESHKYLIKKHDIKQCLDLLKRCLLDY